MQKLFQSLLSDGIDSLDNEPHPKPKKKKPSKKLKRAQVGIMAFNKFRTPMDSSQRSYQFSNNNIGAVPQGYRQPDAPPLPFQQRNADMNPMGTSQQQFVSGTGQFSGPTVASLQQIRSPQPFSLVSPANSLRSPLVNGDVNRQIGLQTLSNYTNPHVNNYFGDNEFIHPPPSNPKLQSTWRKSGTASQFVTKLNMARRKSVLEITDVDNTESGTEVFESTA